MASTPPLHSLRMTHIGGPTVLIEIDSLRLLTDPTFEPAGFQYESGPQVIRKMASPALPLAALEPVDAVLLSHDQHRDNLDPAGRELLSRVRQVLTTPVGAQRLGGTARGIPCWETVHLTSTRGLDVRVTAIPAQHGAQEILSATGDVTGWVLEWEGQQHGTLYLSGDTVFYEGLQEVAQRYQISVAVLNFGAAQSMAFGPIPLTLTGEGGVRLAEMLGNAVIVPIHYEGWSHFTEGRSEIEQAFAAAGLEPRLHFLPFGQPIPFDC